jgi:nicotinamidase-related amidase
MSIRITKIKRTRSYKKAVKYSLLQKNEYKYHSHSQHIDIAHRLPFFQPDTFGIEFHEKVKPLANEAHFIKHSPNAFHEPRLLEYLNENSISNLTICVMMTHMCVDATVRAAKDYGFNIELLSDGCATTDMLFKNHIIELDLVHHSFIGALEQYYASIISSDKLIEFEENKI